ncbi:uncharacterized protein LOC100720257 isoform X2 [Cavia porcellus]|uniref:uncharacterized protein LOC100720257 isoform X2 n=1 Tax=Cavia porcellus TaxID=10141 RepID=UPI002FDFCC9C
MAILLLQPLECWDFSNMGDPRGGGEVQHLKVRKFGKEKQRRGGSCFLFSGAPWVSVMTPHAFDNCCVRTRSVRYLQAPSHLLKTLGSET